MLDNDRRALDARARRHAPASPSMALVLSRACAGPGCASDSKLDFRHPAVRRLLTLSGWTFGYVVANQVAIVVCSNLADPGSGDASAYFDAYIFFVLPARPPGDVDRDDVRARDGAVGRPQGPRTRSSAQTSLGVRLIALLTCRRGSVSSSLRRPIVGAFLQHGEFTAAAADNTSPGTRRLRPRPVGFSVYLFALRGFYAHQDTRTPVRHQPLRVRAQHRARVRPRTAVRRPRAQPRLRHRQHRRGRVGVAGAVVQGARLPDRAACSATCGRWWWRAWSPPK